MLDALRQVVHLRAYAQRKPIDEYKHEAFAMFERMLTLIREDVTASLAQAQFRTEPAPLPDLPDFLTQHIDPFSGEDDTFDIDAGTGAILSQLPPLQAAEPALEGVDGDVLPVSRNAPCPCGSGKKYKHCHGVLA